MKNFYPNILKSIAQKSLAVLIDPDKMDINNLRSFCKKLNASIATHIFVGGSTVAEDVTGKLVIQLKKHTTLPIVLFPGDITQITNHADAILFLSLISGRNPDYLIGKHVESVSKLKQTTLEIIPTGYILIENGTETAVQSVTQTQPLSKTNIQNIVDTAKAGEWLGMQLVYLEAGSGAIEPVDSEIIKRVKNELNIPIIVGGGIKTKEQLENAYQCGADLVVIGTAFENDMSFFDELKKQYI